MPHALILRVEISEQRTETLLDHAFHLPPDKTHDTLSQDGERDNFDGVVLCQAESGKMEARHEWWKERG